MMLTIWRRAEEAPKAKAKMTKCERVKKAGLEESFLLSFGSQCRLFESPFDKHTL